MNSLTAIAILGWPIFGLLLFASQKDPKRGAILSILVGFLFLPSSVGIDLAGLPALDRDNIVALTLIGALLFGGRVKMPLAIGGGFYMLAIFVYAVSPLFTAMTNSDPIIAGPRTIPGMQLYDGLSMSAGETFRLFPLFIGYWLITSVRDQRMMLTMIVIAGLCYSLILLIEVRLSPQFHKTIYGFHPSGFSSSSRGSGFRPRGFLVNGLVAAFFTLTVVIATLAIWRDDRTRINEGLNKAGDHKAALVRVGCDVYDIHSGNQPVTGCAAIWRFRRLRHRSVQTQNAIACRRNDHNFSNHLSDPAVSGSGAA